MKMLDGTSINGSAWMFFGTLSDLPVWVVVRDLETDRVVVWHSEDRSVCGVADIGGFLTALGPEVKTYTRPAAAYMGGQRSERGQTMISSRTVDVSPSRLRGRIQQRLPKRRDLSSRSVRSSSALDQRCTDWLRKPGQNYRRQRRFLDLQPRQCGGRCEDPRCSIHQ